MKVRVYLGGSDYSGVPWAFFAHPDNEESCANARALTVSLAGHDDIHVVDLEVPAAVMLQTRPLPPIYTARTESPDV
jgi:hypothetical protein